MMLNSLSFCLSVKLLNSPSYLNEILAGYSNLGCRLFFLIGTNIKSSKGETTNNTQRDSHKDNR